jgi:protein-L-isoaspartate(D-aspartate) O-methyltransferase
MMGAAMDGERQRRGLVRILRKAGHLRDERVAEAFATVPRHVFLPGEKLKDVYTNRAFPTKRIDGWPVSSSSEPAIMAVMLEQLDVVPGDRVLEIGAGTGYNAGLLAHLADARGRVTAVDIDDDIVAGARAHLRAAGARRVRVTTGDGALGEPGGAPYDRIIVTASCWEIPEAWHDQLVEGGMLVLPLRLNGAHVSLALRKEGDALVSTRAAMCGFMPMRGVSAPVHTALALPDARVAADVKLPRRVEHALPDLLRRGRKVRAGYPAPRDAMNAPLYYLALQGRPLLLAIGNPKTWGGTPFVLLASEESAVALPWVQPPDGKLRLYGTREALDVLRDALARWREEGQPDLRDLRAVVRPSNARLGSLPKSSGGRYRFRRGAHAYELWFQR